jgi:hypothetical protein
MLPGHPDVITPLASQATIPPPAGLTATVSLEKSTNYSFFYLPFQSDGIGSVGTFDLMYQAPWPLES